MTKTERIFNLIQLLLSTRRPLSASDIRERIPGYGAQSDDAFHRMFERDKGEIRDLGFALEQEDLDAWGGEKGYRIRRQDALLDDPGLTPEEMAALSLAAQAWGDTEDGALGVLKLSVGSGVAEPGPTGWVLPRVTVDETVAALMDAVGRRKTVRFFHRSGGGGEPEERTVDPYGLHHRGVWYLVGFDHKRGEVRRFKLPRVVGGVSVSRGSGPDFDPPQAVALSVRHGPWEGDVAVQSRVAFSNVVAWWVERRTGARRLAEREDGWVELALPVADVPSFAAWLAGFGDDAVAVEPDELREAIVAHLRGVTGDPS